jgi:hypothetical protein
MYFIPGGVPERSEGTPPGFIQPQIKSNNKFYWVKEGARRGPDWMNS